MTKTPPIVFNLDDPDPRNAREAEDTFRGWLSMPTREARRAYMRTLRHGFGRARENEPDAQLHRTRVRKQKAALLEKREVSDDTLRAEYWALKGSHKRRLVELYLRHGDKPGCGHSTLYRRLAKLGCVTDDKPARRRCLTCGVEFQPRRRHDDRLCRKHRPR